MENNITLGKITQGLMAIERIKGILGADVREDYNSKVKADRVDIVHETMKAIVDFFPTAKGVSVGSALKRCNEHCNTYKEMKQHLRDMRGKQADMNHVSKALKVMSPILKNSQKIYFDKIIKILDIISS